MFLRSGEHPVGESNVVGLLVTVMRSQIVSKLQVAYWHLGMPDAAALEKARKEVAEMEQTAASWGRTHPDA
jgi:late competence protein required for DNA uptake (superfamily II DNA/RNA helicase)